MRWEEYEAAPGVRERTEDCHVGGRVKRGGVFVAGAGGGGEECGKLIWVQRGGNDVTVTAEERKGVRVERRGGLYWGKWCGCVWGWPGWIREGVSRRIGRRGVVGWWGLVSDRRDSG